MSLVSAESLLSDSVRVHRSVSDGIVEYLVQLDNKLGYLEASFDQVTDIFDIEMFYTAVPRKGLGKLLLRSALGLAEEAQAELITAYIISRTSLDSMTEVFGADTVTVKNRGEYGRRNTLAYLNYYTGYHQS